jgi:hypothetical protein
MKHVGGFGRFGDNQKPNPSSTQQSYKLKRSWVGAPVVGEKYYNWIGYDKDKDGIITKVYDNTSSDEDKLVQKLIDLLYCISHSSNGKYYDRLTLTSTVKEYEQLVYDGNSTDKNAINAFNTTALDNFLDNFLKSFCNVTEIINILKKIGYLSEDAEGRYSIKNEWYPFALIDNVLRKGYLHEANVTGRGDRNVIGLESWPNFLINNTKPDKTGSNKFTPELSPEDRDMIYKIGLKFKSALFPNWEKAGNFFKGIGDSISSSFGKKPATQQAIGGKKSKKTKSKKTKSKKTRKSHR